MHLVPDGSGGFRSKDDSGCGGIIIIAGAILVGLPIIGITLIYLIALAIMGPSTTSLNTGDRGVSVITTVSGQQVTSLPKTPTTSSTAECRQQWNSLSLDEREQVIRTYYQQHGESLPKVHDYGDDDGVKVAYIFGCTPN